MKKLIAFLLAFGMSINAYALPQKYEGYNSDAQSVVAYGYNGSTLVPVQVDSSGKLVTSGGSGGGGNIGSSPYSYINVCTTTSPVDCTGATNSNVALQNIVNTAEAANEGLYFPPGSIVLLDNATSAQTYTINPAVSGTTYYGGVKLYGTNMVIWGYGATIETPSATVPTHAGSIFFAVNGGNKGLKILGLRANGHRINWVSQTYGQAAATQSDPLPIAFFRADQMNNITVRDTYINNFSANAIAISGDGSQANEIYIEKNHFKDNGSRYPDYQHGGLNINDGNEGLISTYSPNANEQNHVDLEYVDNFKINDNWMERSWGDNMHLVGDNKGHVDSNIITNTKMGFLFDVGCSHVTHNGNIVYTDQLDYADTKLWSITQTTGSGLNDVIISVNSYAPVETTAPTYLVQVCATGTPDTFKVAKNGGSYGACFSASTTHSVVIDALDPWVRVAFGATTGHTTGNIWTITGAGYVRGSHPVTIEGAEYTNGPSTYLDYIDNHFYNIGRSVFVHGGQNINFKDNTFDQMGQKAATPENQFTSVSNMYISYDNTSSTVNSYNIDIEGNTFYGNSNQYENLDIVGDVQGVVAKNNTFINPVSNPTKGNLYLDDRVMGSDGHWYRCILAHTAASGNEPITGGSYATYWVKDDTNRTVSDSTPSRPWVTGSYYNVANTAANLPTAYLNENLLSTDYGAGNLTVVPSTQYAENVGIGSITPGQALDVNGTVRMTGFTMPTGASNTYVMTSDANGNGSWAAAGGGGGLWNTTNTNDVYEKNGSTFGNVSIGTSVTNGGATLAVIGNVGIGTISAANKLQVNGAASFGTYSASSAPSNGIIVSGNVSIGTTSNANVLEVYGSSTNSIQATNTTTPAASSGAGIAALTSVIPTGADQRLGFYTMGANDSGTNRNAVAIQAFSNQAWTSGSQIGAYMTFNTTPSGSITRAERVRIDGAGNVGIGTTTMAQVLVVNGTITQKSQISCATGLTSDATGAINGCVASDELLKTNIMPLPYDPQLIMKLNPVSYEWKDNRDNKKIHTGFIAQQVNKDFPQAVIPAGGTHFGVDPNAVLSVVVNEEKHQRESENVKNWIIGLVMFIIILRLITLR